jgi:hypothetical protein
MYNITRIIALLAIETLSGVRKRSDHCWQSRMVGSRYDVISEQQTKYNMLIAYLASFDKSS